MISTYDDYLTQLGCIANEERWSSNASEEVYPRLKRIKALILNYEDVLEPFSKVQSELLDYVSQLKFGDDDYDNLEEIFKELRRISEEVSELKFRAIGTSLERKAEHLANEIYAGASVNSTSWEGPFRKRIIILKNDLAESRVRQKRSPWLLELIRDHPWASFLIMIGAIVLIFGTG
jgi:predicted DNA-binding protein YlxM (UPF0122 family)